MKRFFFTLFLIAGVTLAYANTSNTGLSYDGRWLSINDSIVINEDSLQFVTITMEDENKRNSFDHWSISGDLKVNPDYSPNATSIQISSHGAGKGRLAYIYNQVGCGSMSVSIDIYKRFNPNVSPYNIEISGPDCILEGDTVVYSIKPILTKNLTQGIGVDEYFWTFTPGLVQEHIYKAGDNSSVTFVAGAVTGNDSIKVQVGIANASDSVSKTLGKAAPKPVFLSSTCVPYGKAPITFEVEQEEGVKYHWASSDNNWRFATRTQSGNIVTVTPNENTSPFITITATYTNGDGCNGSSTSVEIHRTWGNSIILQKEGDIYNRCVSDTTLFILDGQVAGSGVHWDLPKGWDFINDDTIGFSISIKPINPDSVLLKDTIVAVSKDTCDKIYRKSSWIYVKPASVTSITDYGCLKTDTTYKFKITGWEHGPKAEYYKWIAGNDTTVSGDSLIWQSVVGIQEVKIIPRGEIYDGVHYYWGDTATFTLTYQPIMPDSIISFDTCLFSQREIETTLHVHTPIVGQTYHWTSIPGWNMSYDSQNPNDSSIVTYSCANALQGEYPIFVSALGLGDCSLSSSKEYSIKVDTIEWEIAYQYSWWSKKFEFLLIYQENVPDELITANWYVNDESTYTTTDMLPLSQMPQTLRADFTIGGCDYSIPLPTSGMAAPQKRINQLEDLPGLTLYPNPAHNQLLTQWDQEGKFNIAIIDAEGKIITTESVVGRNANVNISSIPDGHYIVVIRGGRYYSAKQLIIKH